MAFLFGGGASASQSEPKVGNLQVQSTGYGVTVSVVMGTHRVPCTLTWYGDFRVEVHEQSGGKGFGGGGGKSYSYFASIMLLCGEGYPGLEFGKLWVNKKRYADVADLDFIKFSGSGSGGGVQARWSHLVSKHPDDADHYNRFAYIAVADYSLMASASIGNHSVEIKGLYRSGGGLDVEPRFCMIGLLSDTQWGCGWDSGRIDAMEQVGSYCRAYNIAISPALAEQTPAADILKRWAQIADAGLVWSAGVLRGIPYSSEDHGDFVADSSTGIHLGPSDYLSRDDEDPVRVTTKLKADMFNKVTVEYHSRAHNYDVRTVTWGDDADIRQHGLRPMPNQVLHEICDRATAWRVARSIGMRELHIRRTYEFRLAFEYSRLEPMDIVYLTEPSLGLDDEPVRLTKVVDNPDGSLELTAEEMPFGAADADDSTEPESSGFDPLDNIAVGPMNAPVAFVAPMALTGNKHQVWIALSNPDPNYGGCVVYSSLDGQSYKRRGAFYGSSAYGVTTTALPAGDDPDTDAGHALAVDLSLSEGGLLPANADDYEVCLAGGEFVGYRHATLTSQYHYDLTTPPAPGTARYLRRGLYGSTQGVSSGSPFVLVNPGRLYKLDIRDDDFGKTLHLKFTAFNVFNESVEDLDTVTQYTLALTSESWNSTAAWQWLNSAGDD